MTLQDRISNKLGNVNSVSSFVNHIQILEKEWCTEKREFLVFRGEEQEYPVPCVPTIFRDYALKESKSYEINMFLAMRQNEISNSGVYLKNAIDAQHDGFPSRLLDVSYNCLMALYFATTPYYADPEDKNDDKDGVVYVLKYDETYSPEAENTQMIYETSLKKNDSIPLWGMNHILIDHCKQNKRIIAQQGAFVLFLGDVPTPLPFNKLYGIRIDKNAKPKIRKELKALFGIYTGSVYPEVELMQEKIKEECLRLNTDIPNNDSNIRCVIQNYQREYDYFSDCCDYYAETNQEQGELLRLIEKSIVYDKQQVKRLAGYIYRLNMGNKENEIKAQDFVNKYNYVLEDFIKQLPSKWHSNIDNDVLDKLEGFKGDHND